MILCVCPNPSIDTYAWLDEHQPGNVTRINRLHEYPGGKAIHVALALSELGTKAIIFGNWAGPNGEWIKNECKKKGIVIKGINLEGNNRKCYTFRSHDLSLNDSELIEPGPIMSDQGWDSFLHNFQKQLECCELACISGSWPMGAPNDAYLQLVNICNRLGKKAIVDCSGIQLRNVLKAKFFGLHINEHEAMDVFETKSQGEIFSKLKRNVSLIALTKGNKGLFLNHEGIGLHGNVKIDHVISSVGSGDCLTAGIAFAVHNELSSREIVKYGVALGAANCLSEDLGILQLVNVKKLLPEVEINDYKNVE